MSAHNHDDEFIKKISKAPQKTPKKVSDFEVMQKIAQEGNPDGIAMFPDMVSCQTSNKGVLITMGAPIDVLDWQLKESHFFVLYAIKKDDYRRVVKELESK